MFPIVTLDMTGGQITGIILGLLVLVIAVVFLCGFRIVRQTENYVIER